MPRISQNPGFDYRILIHAIGSVAIAIRVIAEAPMHLWGILWHREPTDRVENKTDAVQLRFFLSNPIRSIIIVTSTASGIVVSCGTNLRKTMAREAIRIKTRAGFLHGTHHEHHNLSCQDSGLIFAKVRSPESDGSKTSSSLS